VARACAHNCSRKLEIHSSRYSPRDDVRAREIIGEAERQRESLPLARVFARLIDARDRAKSERRLKMPVVRKRRSPYALSTALALAVLDRSAIGR